jgi:LPPG:FO 2-phospho-L-lactate transferase
MTGGDGFGENGRVVALCGGVGGAKLALGLSKVVAPERLAVIVNTGDDFRHFGLSICPDLDTVTYTLAGRVNAETGWGRAGETWRFMEAVGELGGEDWFNLGDTDLATHAVRTARLAAGARLTEVTRDIARALGVGPAILPASDDPVATVVDTAEGALPFQRYFVGRRCQPAVRGLRYQGATEARPAPEVVGALSAPDLKAIVVCPSNPYLSLDPMLAVPGFRALIRKCGAPVVAVSPIVGGAAIKGPLAKMMTELGHAAGSQSIADHYADLLDVLVIDETDRQEQISTPSVHVARTVMRSLDDRIALAREVLGSVGMPSEGAST